MIIGLPFKRSPPYNSYLLTIPYHGVWQNPAQITMITSLPFIRLSSYNGYLLFMYVNERLSPFITYHMWNSNHNELTQSVVQRISPHSLTKKNALQGILLRISPYREDIIYKRLHLKILPLNNDLGKLGPLVTPSEFVFPLGFLSKLL